MSKLRLGVLSTAAIGVQKVIPAMQQGLLLSLIHISEPTRPTATSRMPSSA